DPADVGGPRPRRKAPRWRGGDLAQRGQLTPRRPAVPAAEHHARLAAGVDRAICRADGDREDVRLRELQLLPLRAAVAALPDSLAARANAECSRLMGIQRQALRAAADECQLYAPLTVSPGNAAHSTSRCNNQVCHQTSL